MPITELQSTRWPRPFSISRMCISEHRGKGRGRERRLWKDIRIYLLWGKSIERGDTKMRLWRPVGWSGECRGVWGASATYSGPDSEALTSEGGKALAPGLSKDQRVWDAWPGNCDQLDCPPLPLCSASPFDEVTNETVSCPQGGGLKAGVGG